MQADEGEKEESDGKEKGIVKRVINSAFLLSFMFINPSIKVIHG